MKGGFLCGILYSIGIALISKGMYDLGKEHERKEFKKILATLEVARKTYEKDEEES